MTEIHTCCIGCRHSIEPYNEAEIYCRKCNSDYSGYQLTAADEAAADKLRKDAVMNFVDSITVETFIDYVGNQDYISFEDCMNMLHYLAKEFK